MLPISGVQGIPNSARNIINIQPRNAGLMLRPDPNVDHNCENPGSRLFDLVTVTFQGQTFLTV